MRRTQSNTVCDVKKNAAPKRRKYVFEVDLNAKYKPVKYKQFSIDEMLKHKLCRMNDNKENILNADPIYIE